MNLEQLLQAYLAEVALRPLEASTQRGYRLSTTHLLRALGGQIPAGSLGSEHLGEYMKYLHSRGMAGTSRYQHLRALRVFLHWAYEQGHLARDLSLWMRIPPCPRPAAWVPSWEQVQQLLSAPRDFRTGRRNRFIFELVYGTGLRAIELSRLKLADIEAEGLWVRQGKGHKDRLQPLGPNLQARIREYLEQVRPHSKPHPQEDSLLLTETGGPLKRRALEPILEYYARRLQMPKLTFHSLRRAFATHMLVRGAPLAEVQRLLGHESPETTVLYTQIQVEDVQREFRRTHPRARRKKTRAAGV